jgi:shikimate kinase
MPEPPVAGHVVLVGLMGSGKSTVGRRLAEILDRDFVDADAALEAREGRSIAEIFAGDGEAAFRKAEEVVLGALLDRERPTVVAAGGGVVVADANRARLNGPGITVVWLDASPAFLASRAKAKAHRPLLATGDPRRTFARLHAERGPLYSEVADVVCDVEPFHRSEDRPKLALASEIARLVRDHEQATAGARR